MKDPKHPDFEENDEFYDFKNLNPYKFDIDEVNANLLEFKDAVAYHKSIVKGVQTSF